MKYFIDHKFQYQNVTARESKKKRETHSTFSYPAYECVLRSFRWIYISRKRANNRHPCSGYGCVRVRVCVSTTINKYVKHRRVNRWWHQRFTTSKLSPHPPSPLLFIVGKCLFVVMCVCVWAQIGVEKKEERKHIVIRPSSINSSHVILHNLIIIIVIYPIMCHRNVYEASRTTESLSRCDIRDGICRAVVSVCDV